VKLFYVKRTSISSLNLILFFNLNTSSIKTNKFLSESTNCMKSVSQLLEEKGSLNLYMARLPFDKFLLYYMVFIKTQI